VTASDTLPAADRVRAAKLLLACMSDDGIDEANAVLAEAFATDGGAPALIACLCSGVLELLVSACGEQRTIALLSTMLTDAELDRDEH
jgi:hypothetical protein